MQQKLTHSDISLLKSMLLIVNMSGRAVKTQDKNKETFKEYDMRILCSVGELAKSLGYSSSQTPYSSVKPNKDTLQSLVNMWDLTLCQFSSFPVDCCEEFFIDDFEKDLRHCKDMGIGLTLCKFVDTYRPVYKLILITYALGYTMQDVYEEFIHL